MSQKIVRKSKRVESRKAKPGSLHPAGSATSIETISVFKGETWLAYRPGEDATFKDAWVSRTERGVMCSVLNSKKDLIANAKLCKVRLKWPNESSSATPHKGR